MPELINLYGQRFGRLFVTGRGSNGPKGQPRWFCTCDCGTGVTVYGQSLRTGVTSSCGCLRLERTIAANILRPYEAIYNRMLQYSRPPHRLTIIRVDLTYEEFVAFTAIKECHYCNAPVNWLRHRERGLHGGYNLDRKDSNGPYSTENCVVCCARCNQCKSNKFTYYEWLAIGQTIRGFAA